ncbi:hypothetical protein FK531_15790 [Rhodococcus spelaei]|uniref:IPT/TIG domain-containing protein n=1 Tax=Rhodococcus spelaei TaxID=2546320 RepID=A0A541B416_9NOCA|nr:hypothetical protein [Rhodococcus spelaei]TQF67040.1 hypothetical protein FK531_15790 [Rhodococcus spelaei]
MRTLSRAAIAVTAVAVAWATPVGVAGAVSGTPSTSVSKTTNLRADGETITVSGSGFSADGPGIYVGLVQDNRFTTADAGAWISSAFVRPDAITGGSWSTSLDVTAVAGGSDCTRNSCSIYTVAAHGSSDRSQDTRVPVAFAAPPVVTTPPTTTTQPPVTTTQPPVTTTTPPPTTTTQPPVTTTTTTKPPTTTTKPVTTTTSKPPVTTTTKPTTTTTTPPTTTTNPPSTTTAPTTTAPSTTTPTPAPDNGPTVNADRTSGLNPAGDTITVSGQRFSTSGTGIYIGVAQMSRYSTTDASVFQDAKFVKPADMPGGSWSTTLNVSSTFAGSDCMANACAVYTLAAHGSSDRSQDTVTRITFAGAPTPAEPPASSGAKGNGGTAGGTNSGGANSGTGVGAVTTNSALSVSLSKASELDPAGESVTISGSGFSGAAPGLYVGMVQDNVFSNSDASVWMTTAFLKPDAIPGGSWSITMQLPSVVGAYDCVRNACSIYTVAAHGSSDRSQDSKTPVSFVGGVAPGTVTAPPATAASGDAAKTVAVTLSKARGLKVEGETITVSGTGFAATGPGIYVGLIQDDKFSTTDASAWMTTAFITPNKIENGAWTTEMEVAAVKGDSDCTKNSCAIYTIAAHGSSDRSQDTKSPVSFGDDLEADAASAAVGAGSGTSGSPSAALRSLDSSLGGHATWILPLLVGGGLGAGIAVATTAALRRRQS